jgi:hydrogenase maturation protease
MGDRPLVIGVGNRDRGDDAAGPVVCDLLGEVPGVRTLVLEGSVIDLPARWSPDDDVVIVDAAAPAGTPGRVFEVDALADRLVPPSTVSTHTVDVAAAIELARVLDRLPRSLRVIGIEGESFEHGTALSSGVAPAVRFVAARLAEEAGSGTAAVASR